MYVIPPYGLGDVAQLGERVNGIHEVRGSIPLVSTARTGPRVDTHESAWMFPGYE